MSARRLLLAVATAVAVVGPLVPSASLADSGTFSSWTARDDDADGSVRTTTWSPDGGATRMGASLSGLGSGQGEELGAWTHDGERGLRLLFQPPRGQALEAGATYRVRATPRDSTVGRLWVGSGNDQAMCAQPEDDWTGWQVDKDDRPPAVGTFTIVELQRGADGSVERLAATYDVGCQVVGGPKGLAGSIAVDASTPAEAVPAPDPVSAPVRDLRIVNTGPTWGGYNTSELTWAKPAGARDTLVEFMTGADPADLPDVVGRRGEAALVQEGGTTSYREQWIEGIGSRVWRVTPRSATGRLGPSTIIVVRGTRVATDYDGVRATVGKPVTVRGRVSESWAYTDPADVMKGPAVRGAVVRLCGQRTSAGAWQCVDSARTDADGRFVLSVVPDGNTDYQVVATPTARFYAEASYAVAAKISPYTDLATTAPTGSRAGSVRFTTSRAKAGAKGSVSLQRLDGSRWRTLATKKLGNGKGRLAFAVRGARPGQQFRVVKPADARHTTGVSQVVRLR